MTKALHRFRNELIAFWYCNKSALGLILCVFMTVFLVMPLPPGIGIRTSGIVLLSIFAIAIVLRPDSGYISHDPQDKLKHEIYALWRKEEPWWSPLVMLILLLMAGFFFLFKPEILKNFFTKFFY